MGSRAFGAVIVSLIFLINQRSGKSAPITGDISFSGGETFYQLTNGTGQVASDLTMARSVKFGTTMSFGGDGSLAVIPFFTQVTMMTNALQVNPPALPSV